MKQLFVVVLLCCSSALAQAPRWTATQLEPILIPDQPWEGHIVGEPNVRRRDDGLYEMWYTAGWNSCAVGYATSHDGLTWTKHADNPILGHWRGGVAVACHIHVFVENSTYFLYFANDTDRGELYVATSSDGVYFQVQPGPILRAPAYWSRGNIGNTFIWREGDTYWMATEAQGRDWVWRSGPAKGASPLGPFTQLANGVSTQTWPSLCPRGSYGHPWIIARPGGYDIWYHCAPLGDLPTDIWHAYTSGSITVDQWHRDKMPLIVHSGIGWAVDQVADPCLVRRDDGSFLMYYDGVNNPAASGAIGLAVLLP